MSGYRPPYTIDEERQILRYICTKKLYYKLRGKGMWVEMQNEGIGDRTWQSLKEHFRKQILPKINDHRLGLTEQEIRAIREGYDQTAMTQSNAKPKASTPNTPQAKAVDLTNVLTSDSSDEEL